MTAKNGNVGIWLRVSTEDQVKGESPKHHEARARAYAASKGWTVTTIYDLGDWSGRSVKDHPECKRMMRDVQAGTISALVFSKLARVARNTRELLDFADYFDANKADLVSLQEAIDTSTPAGRLFYTLIAAMAQWEREETAERVAASVPIRAKLGKPLGGAAPFGYRWQDRKLVPDDVEAPVRRLVYELFLEHRRKQTVARLMNQRGFRTRRGGRWNYSTVAWLLSDPTAVGRRRANYTRTRGSGKSPTIKPQSEWVWLDVPPIVPEELWNRCNQILVEQKEGRKPVKRVRHLFAGRAFCECGTKMRVPSNSPKYVCTSCKNKIPVQDLETIFHNRIQGFLVSTDEVHEQLAKSDEEAENRRALIASMETEQAKLTAEMDKVMDLYVADQVSKDGFSARYAPLEERRNRIRDEVPRLQGELDFLRISLASSDQFIRDSQDLYDHWPQLEFDEKARIVEQVVERITVGRGEIELNLSFQPTTVTQSPCTSRRSATRGRA